MIELRITGEKPEEFYLSLLRTTSLLLNPPRANPAPTPAAEPAVVAEPVAEPVAGEASTAEPLENPTVAEAEIDPPVAKKPRGRPAKAKPAEEPEQIELEAAIAAAPERKTMPEPKPVPPLPEGGDRVDDLFVSKPAETPAEPAKTYTVEDCRAALKTVFDNYEERQRAAGNTDESAIMRGKTTYAKPLVYGFDVQKVVDLKPDQYAAFIAAARPYIDGTVKEAV
jgi:hypothetical protein